MGPGAPEALVLILPPHRLLEDFVLINTMSASNYSLKINRDLLDPGFESYRLSQDSIPIYKVDLDAGEATSNFKYAAVSELAS